MSRSERAQLARGHIPIGREGLQDRGTLGGVKYPDRSGLVGNDAKAGLEVGLNSPGLLSPIASGHASAALSVSDSDMTD